MSYGVFNDYPYKSLVYVNSGVLIDGNRYDLDPNKITESVYNAWYDDNNEPNVYKEDAYTWVKSPISITILSTVLIL